MYLKLQENKELNSTINKLYKKYSKEIMDIFIFGSAIKGKDKPKDLDILILFKNKENLDITYDFKTQLQGYNSDIITKTWAQALSPNFQAREALLSEAYSLVNKQFLSESLGYKNQFLFNYEQKNLSSSERIRFHYALYGRNKNAGIMKTLSLKKLSDSVILCPITNVEKFKEFLNTWKIKHDSYPILIPTRKL